MILRKSLRIISLLSLVVTAPLQANADDWDKYLQIMNRFYYLDQQEFKRISCNIEVPIINNILSQIHTQFNQMRDKIDIKENIASFSLIYSNKKGLNINYPSLNVKIISEKGIADLSKAKKGIEMVNAGFKQQIEGVGEQLKGIFEGFETPKKDRYKIKEVKYDNGVCTVKYEKDSSNFTEIYSENQRKVTQIDSNGGKISSIENYDKSPNGKLMLTNAHVNMDLPMTKIEMDVSLSYEKVKDVFFPTRVVSHINQFVQTIKQEGQIDIYLKNCTLE